MPIINNLGGNEIEILKLADFLTGVEQDITDVYFGDLQVFTVWAETEGTFPLTISANGENLINYRIYGNTEQTGTPTPSDPIVPSECGERTKNLYNWRTDIQYSYITSNGAILSLWASSSNYVSEKIHVVAGKTYQLIRPIAVSGTGLYAAFYDENDAVLSVTTLSLKSSYALEAPTGASYFRTSLKRDDAENDISMLTEGSTAPAQYIPFGYQLNIVVGDGTTGTDIPIYIGSTPLEQGEYVDYGEQKVYKYVDGVLTPTDPPVALPAIPTLDGTTVYDADLVTKPSKMHIKYRKHGT